MKELCEDMETRVILVSNWIPSEVDMAQTLQPDQHCNLTEVIDLVIREVDPLERI
jgi:hypothetical protein